VHVQACAQQRIGHGRRPTAHRCLPVQAVVRQSIAARPDLCAVAARARSEPAAATMLPAPGLIPDPSCSRRPCSSGAQHRRARCTCPIPSPQDGHAGNSGLWWVAQAARCRARARSCPSRPTTALWSPTTPARSRRALLPYLPLTDRSRPALHPTARSRRALGASCTLRSKS
jgi:hypothetical protein